MVTTETLRLGNYDNTYDREFEGFKREAESMSMDYLEGYLQSYFDEIGSKGLVGRLVLRLVGSMPSKVAGYKEALEERNLGLN